MSLPIGSVILTKDPTKLTKGLDPNPGSGEKGTPDSIDPTQGDKPSAVVKDSVSGKNSLHLSFIVDCNSTTKVI